MPDTIDANEIAVGVANHIFDSTVKGVTSTLSLQVKKIEVKFKKDFASYISASIDRTNKIKTIIHPDESCQISQLYVPLNYKVGKERKSDTDILTKIRAGGKVLVSGTAGGGKSMLIKSINVSLLSEYKDLLPIFFELRNLNGKKGVSLLDAIFDAVNFYIKSIDMDIFLDYLRRGKFALILDGFDEVNYDQRSMYGSEINDICKKYPDLSIIITSRPEEDLPGLQDFVVFHCLPMSVTQTVSLIKKIDFDPEKKNQFIEHVKDHLYGKHAEFLSNPLMTTMMLLTYSYHSDIPEKIHIFYQQAFETLFQRHDRSKGVYTRKSYTELPLDEFQRILEFFCASSYISSDYSFDGDQIRSYIKKSINYTKSVVSVDDFLADLKESVCIIQNDGLELSFVHRSFQEYFTAKFISALPDDRLEDAIDTVCTRSGTDSVVKMVLAISPDKLERQWVLPKLTELVLKSSGEKGSIALVPDVFDHLSLFPSGVTLANSEDYWGAIAMTVWSIYGMFQMGGSSGSSDLRSSIRRVSANPELLGELKNICVDGDDLIDKFIEKDLFTNKEDEELSAFLDPRLMSNDLYEMFGVDFYFNKEIDIWKSIVDRISIDVGRKENSFEELFSD